MTASICSQQGHSAKSDFATEQRKDEDISKTVKHLEHKSLPESLNRVQQIIGQSLLFKVMDHALYLVD